MTSARRITGVGLLPGDGARRVALGWVALALVVGALAGERAGFGAAESRLFDAALRQGTWWTRLPGAPLASLNAVDAAMAPERGASSLPVAAAGVGHALLGERLPKAELLAFRLASLLFAALLAYLLSRFGADLAGTAGAALAPALLFLVPAAFDATLHAGADVAAAALWLGVLLAHHRCLRSRDHRQRVRRALTAGLLFGAAVATRRDAWLLLPLLAFHYLAVRAGGRLHTLQSGDEAPPHPAGRSAWRSLLAGMPASLPAMLILGPLVFAALTPWIWADPARRLLPAARAALASSPFVHLGTVVSGARPPWSAPLLAALLLPPAAIGLVWLAGLGHAARRLQLGWRREAAASFSDELLLLLGALAPLVLAALGVAPAEAGLGPALPGAAVLAVLGARAIVTAAHTAWPSRAARLTVAVALLALYPAVRATARTWRHGAAAWSEWVGLAPGAASLGLPRCAEGAGTTLAAELSERAAEGQRVWFSGLPVRAAETLRHDGLLRADLRVAASPADADLAVVEIDDARRDVEYQVWTAFETARPVAAVRLDEVPLAHVYARPGAWR